MLDKKINNIILQVHFFKLVKTHEQAVATKSRQDNKSQEEKRNSKICFYCKKHGHIVRDYRTNERRVAAAAAREANRSQQEERKTILRRL